MTLSVLRDYSDDEIDAELRHLGINHPATLRRHAQINIIRNRCAPSHSETDMQRAQDNLDMLRRSQFGSSYAVQSEEFFHELSASTGMAVEKIRALHRCTNAVLKAELTSRNLRFNANASKYELVE